MDFHDGRVVLHIGDCFDVLDTLPENSIDAVCTDPPYHLTSIVARFGETTREDETTSERARAGSDGYARLSRGFMGKEWDGGDIAFNPELWSKVYRVLKPGGHMVAFGGTRTYHRMAVAIEDAGFEIRDMLSWIYGSGFPKSHDISKAIDKSYGNFDFEKQKTNLAIHIRECRESAKVTRSELASWFPEYSTVTQNWERNDAGKRTPSITDYEILIERIKCSSNFRHLVRVEAKRQIIGKSSNGLAQNWSNEGDAGFKKKYDLTAPTTDEAKTWQGWGTALKPAQEPICLARKPLSEPTIAANVLKWGTGALNIDGCRIGDREFTVTISTGEIVSQNVAMSGPNYGRIKSDCVKTGRWPANIATDGSDEVLELFPDSKGWSGQNHNNFNPYGGNALNKSATTREGYHEGFGDEGSAARFFYTAKASELDRIGSKHPTVKPVSLMRWLVRLVTPPNGTVLDMFAGTGTTGQAAMLEGFKSVLIEREVEYVEDIERRMKLVFEKTPLKREKGSTDGATLF